MDESLQQHLSATTTDDHRPRPAESDLGRSGPTTTDNDRPRQTQSSARREEHTLTTKDAVKMFESVGMPRNQRSIERYCTDQKLDCFFESDEQRYYISPGSVERLVAQLKEIRARHESSPDVAMGPTPSDSVRQDATPAPAQLEDPELKTKIKELEDKLFNLEVDRRAKEQVVNMLRDQIKDDRKEYHNQLSSITNQLVSQSHQIGTLEMKLKQIEAPKARRASLDESDLTPPTTTHNPDIHVASASAVSPEDPTHVFEVPIQEIVEAHRSQQV